MISLEDLFCQSDDFCQSFEPRWQATLLGNGLKHRQRRRSLSLSQIMTILLSIHQQSYRNFKHFYEKHVSVYWRQAWTGLPSYQRFVDWMPSSLMPLCVYLQQCFGTCSGISFIDSTSTEGVPQSTHFEPSRVGEPGGTGQNLGRLVLWFQASYRGQRTRRTA